MFKQIDVMPLTADGIITLFTEFNEGLVNPISLINAIAFHNAAAKDGLYEIDVIAHSEKYVAMFQNHLIVIKFTI